MTKADALIKIMGNLIECNDGIMVDEVCESISTNSFCHDINCLECPFNDDDTLKEAVDELTVRPKPPKAPTPPKSRTIPNGRPTD